MITGLDAFDAATRTEVEALKRRPVDRWGQPMFCRDCPERQFDEGGNHRACARRRSGKACSLLAEHIAQAEQAP